MNAAAVLALLGDLYAQVAQLTEENKALRTLLAAEQATEQDHQT